MRKRFFINTRKCEQQLFISFFVTTLFFVIAAWAQCSSPQRVSGKPSIAPKYGGVLKIISVGNPVNLGIPSEPNTPIDIFYSNPAVETLLGLDEKGNVIPWLATSWAVAKDGKSITFTLRKNVTFHDGSDFDAEAVKYVLDTFRNGRKADLKIISSIDVIDKYTVRLNLTEFDNSILPNLTTTPGLMVSPTAIRTHDKTWAMLNPVGTGPFKMVSHERDTRLKYEKFSQYWQTGKPYLDGVEFIFATDPFTALMSFKAGEVHVINRLDTKDALELKATGKYILDKAPSAVSGLAPDGGNPHSPFADIRVRKAVEYAINKQEIATRLFRGVFTPANQTAAPSAVAYNPSIKGYPYNPAKAKELLVQAGYPNGFKTKIIYRTRDLQDFIVTIQGYLKNVGIEAELEAVAPTHYSQITNTGWDNALILWSLGCGIGTEPSQHFRRNFMSQLYKSIIRPDKFNTTVDKAAIERDVKKRNALYKEITRMITDEYATVCPVYVADNIAVRTPQVHDARISNPWLVRWSPEEAWLSK
ncbi:MAG TPA: ABC transporter substrate-binding protein [Syntrophorhabdaceae bacterium]|nr:ABC transporter substrate-binding protein [Syntrophorhabdaceae bacterium]